MRPVRVVLAVVAIALAVVLALLASDLRSWQRTIRDGDLRFTQNPAVASWNAQTVLPASVSRGILGIGDQLDYRAAARRFTVVDALGCGFDNCFTEGRARGNLEVTLTNLTRTGNPKRDSAANNLLGILAYTDSRSTGASTPAPVDRAVSDFTTAVELDPANEYAKFNLEWLLEQLKARGIRPGGSAGTGTSAQGHKGAAGSPPGKGY
jgi:hypothetical protein